MAMASFDFQGDPQFRAWLERFVEDKVEEMMEADRDRRFRESFSLISVSFVRDRLMEHQVSVKGTPRSTEKTGAGASL